MSSDNYFKLALEFLCEKHGGVDEVAEKAGVSAENLKQVLAGTKLPSGRPRGIGPTVRRKLEDAFPNWTQVHLGSSSLTTSDHQSGKSYLSEAQLASQVRPIVDLPTLSWEQIMQIELPQNFSLPLVDDALGEQGAVGDIGIFRLGIEPVQGRGVLLRDRDGGYHVRLYQVRRGTHWLAVSKSEKFATLDSDADGLEVIAVMVGVKWA
jgi:hypothetical protein